MRRRAFIVGIRYRGAPGIPELECPSLDAAEIASRLAALGFIATLILDDQATGARLRRLFREEIPDGFREGEHVLFFFAGHGIASENERGEVEAYLLPCDARPDDPSLRFFQEGVEVHALRETDLLGRRLSARLSQPPPERARRILRAVPRLALRAGRATLLAHMPESSV